MIPPQPDAQEKKQGKVYLDDELNATLHALECLLFRQRASFKRPISSLEVSPELRRRISVAVLSLLSANYKREEIYAMVDEDNAQLIEDFRGIQIRTNKALPDCLYRVHYEAPSSYGPVMARHWEPDFVNIFEKDALND